MEARRRVYELTARRARHFPDLSPMSVDTSGLDARDAGLARALDQEVVRRWLTLEAIASSRLTRPWEQLQPPLQASVLVGTAELLFMHRRADHAAINEAVEWAKSTVRPKAGGLINAVLRGVSRLRDEHIPAPAAHPGDPELARRWVPLSDGSAWQLKEPVFSDDPGRRLAEQTSHHPALITHWSKRHGLAKASELARHSLVQPPLIVTGLPHTVDNPPSGCEPHDEPGFWVCTGGRETLDDLLAGHASVRVQDPTAAAAVRMTEGLSPRRIADVCAGKGTKTQQLATLHPEATILATDRDDARRAVLAETFAGHDRVTVLEPDRVTDHLQTVDLLVFDMPCSNTGVLARRLEARHRFTGHHLSELVQLQRQIIADHLALLTDAGHVLYTTCSLEDEENADQIAWLRRWHQMELLKEAAQMPTGRPGAPPQQYRDGGYAALLSRNAVDSFSGPSAL